jgi:tetratricopeptide (TPR) repeat protein
VLAVATWQQCRIWKDDFTLWHYACARKNVVSTYSWSKYGLLLRDRGDLPGAEAALRRSVEIRPELAQAHMWLGIVYSKMNRPNEALAEYEIAVNLDPGSFEPMYNYGFALMTQNRLQEAADALAKAAQRTPGDTPRLNKSLANAHGNLGLVLLQLNRPDEAEPHLQQAKILDPSRAQALDEVANGYRRSH